MTTLQQADMAAERQARSAATDAAALAIGHPLRRIAIGEAAMRGTTSPIQISRAIEAAAANGRGLGVGSQLTVEHRARIRKRTPQVAYHVRTLVRLGVLEPDRQLRGPGGRTIEHTYRLANTPAATLARHLLHAANHTTHEEMR